MKVKFIIILLFLSILNVKGQEQTTWTIDSLAALQANKLLMDKDINQVMIYENGCIGCDVIGGSDDSYTDGYIEAILIWQKNGRTYLQKVSTNNEEHKEIANLKTLNQLEVDKDKIFSSKFRHDYISIHHDYDRFQLITKNGKREVQLQDYLFDSDNKYAALNKKQPAKIFIDILKAELRKYR